MKKNNRWLYAVIGFIIMLLSGFVYAWSVLAKPISMSRPDWTATQLSLTFTLVMIFFCIGGMIAGFIGKKIPTKLYIITGGILFFLGFFITSKTGSSIGLLYLGFGVVSGFAAGIIYNAVMSCLSAWFSDKQGLISGIMMMGFGISSFLVGKLYTAVTPFDGSDAWQTTFRMMGIIVLIIMLICTIILKSPGNDFIPPVSSSKKTVREPALDVGPGVMLRKPAFWIYYVWAVLIGAAGLAVVSQGSGIAMETGPEMSAGSIATVVGLLSLFNGIGRVIFGTIFDKKGYRFTLTLDMIVYFVAILLMMFALRKGMFGLLTVSYILAGIAYGGVTPTGSALISDFFGRTYYSKNFSVVTTTLMFSSMSSTIAGRLYDVNKSYVSTICMALGLLVISFVISFAIRRPTSENTGK